MVLKYYYIVLIDVIVICVEFLNRMQKNITRLNVRHLSFIFILKGCGLLFDVRPKTSLGSFSFIDEVMINR